MEIKTQIAQKILLLSKTSISELDKYITDLNILMKQKGICVNDLLYYSKQKIGNNKLSLIHKEEYYKNIYQEFIIKYENIIFELISKEMFWDLYYYSYNSIDFIKYIQDNFENCWLIINNINKINEYNIETIIFDEINKIYNILLIKNNNTNIINDLYTDGRKIFLSKKDNYCYRILVKDANFVFQYENSDMIKIKFYCTNLIFDTKTLPDVNIFSSNSLSLDFDNDKINKLTDICNIINNLQKNTDKLNEIYYNPIINNNEFLENSIEKYKFYNEMIKLIIDKYNSLNDEIIKECINNGYTLEEIFSSTNL